MKTFVPKSRLLIICALLFLAVGYNNVCEAQVSIYTTNFGATTSFPAGWTASSADWTNKTDVVSSGYTGASGGSNPQFLNNNITASTLTYSNSLSTIGYQNITLLWGARRTGTATITVTLSWSADGSTWNNVGFTNVANDAVWNLVNGGTRIALPAGAAGIANLRLRLSATASASGANTSYRIDDFTVQGSCAGISQLPTSNLISNYKFTGNAADDDGTNNGTLQNAPTLTSDRFNIANRAYFFNGSTQYVSTANSYVNPTNFTASIWFKTATASGGLLMGFGNAQTGLSANHDRKIYMNNAGQVYFGVYNGAAVTVNSALSYNDNNWHLVTATMSSTSGMVLYIDGAQVAANANTVCENITGYWRIGFENLNGWPSLPASNYFSGSLDDALVYHTALTSTQAATLYNSPDGAGNNGPLCIGSALNLTATTVSGATYAWTGPNGFTSSSQNPTLTYTAAYAGIYTVQVTSGSCTSTAYTNVKTAATSSTISYAGSPYCATAGTAAVTFSGTAGGTYSSTAGLTINATSGSVNLATSTAGTYLVTYAVAGGCTATATITIKATPAAPTVTSPVNYCQNATPAQLTATGTNLLWGGGTVSGSGGGTAAVTGSSSYVDQYATNNRLTLFTTSTANVTVSSVDYYVTMWQTTTSLQLGIFNSSGTLLASSSTITSAPSVGTATKVTNVFNYTIAAAGSYSIGVVSGYGNIAGDSPTFPITESTGTISVTGATTGGASGLRCYNNIQFTKVGSSATAPTPSTTTIGTTNYQVTQTVSGCVSPASIIAVVVSATPTTANAGADQTGTATCGLTTITLAGNAPSSGTGAWTIVSGTGGTVTTPSSGTSTFTGTAGNSYTLRWTISTGCSSSTDDVIITLTAPAGTPTAITGTPPTCQLTNATTTTAFATTSTNSTGFNWSISNPAAGAINAATGVMTWANGFSGTVNIQVTATGCSGPSAQTIRTVTITPTVGTPTAITVGGGTEPTCQILNTTTTTTYFTSSTNSTSYNGSLSNPAAGTINMSTGVVTWAQGFYGSVNIQVTANGCNGPSAMTIRTVNIAQNPTTANAGPDETGATTCGLTTVTLAGNTPTVGTGAWSIISGTGGTVTTPSSPTSTFNGTAGSTYTLRWTISNGSCTSTDDVMITFNRTPTTSAAGPDQTSAGTCGLTTVTLAANAPSIGTGMWSIVSGTGGTITTPTSATSTFNGTAGTTYTLRWSISNNPCTASTDDVIISFNQAPTTSNAGPDQTVAATCGTPSVTLAANTPSVGIGAWTIVSGTGGTVTMPSSATSTFSGAHGTTYTLRWTVSNSPCTASSDDVVITINQYTASADDQSLAGTNTWIGHMYDGINFSPYIGQFTEPETFNESFIGGATCFNVISNSITRSIYTETFSVKFRMNSTKRGLYVVNLGSDDGSRLTVDGTMVYNNWIAQSFTTKPSVLLNLNGASSLLYEFYENSGSNQVMFQNLTLVLANTISTNTAQSICIGNAGSAISGDVYGTLPTGLSLSGTGYQWSYSTTPGGVRTDIAGATGATFTPSAAIAPFNTAGTYYIYRNALVSSTNNIAPNPYVASNESNAATITVSAAPSATISYAGSPYCSSAGIASVTQTGTAGGTYTSTAGLTINASTGAITPGTSTAGTYTVTYAMAAIGGCTAQTATASVTINALPAATISYSGSPFCSNSGTGAVTLTGTAGGTYSSTTGLTINATTGVVTPGTSTVGTYTITYTMASGGCNAQTATTSVTITTLPSATIAYSGSPFCKSAGTAQPVTQSGTNGGVYSSTAGLSIDANTGEIVPATSVAGSYTVTYTIAATGGCTAQTATASVTITPVPSAEFSYPGSPYSVAAGTASVAFSGTAGGTYSSTAGLALNATTGDVTLNTTSPGTYTVTYTAAAAGGCSVYTTTATITVVASTKIFTGTGNFSDPVRWTGGTLPTAGENLVIDGACTVDNSVTTDNIVYGTLTIGTATGRTLSWIAGGTNRLNVSDVSAGAVTSALNMTNGGTLIIRGAWSPINLTFTAGTGTIELQSTLTLPAPYTTYKNLTINGTGIIVKLGAATTVSGDLTITSGTLNSNNLGFSVKGNWINNVSTTAFTAGTSTVTFNGTTAQTIGGTSATTFTNLTIANTLTAVTLNVSTTITGNLSVTAKTFDLGVYTANRAAAGGTLTLSNNTLLKIGGTNTFPTNFTTNTLAVASTVEYYGTNQTVAAKTYGNLTLSSAGGAASKTFASTAFAIVGNLTSTVGAGTSVTLSAAAALTITGNVTIGASTTFNGGGFTHSIAGNWVNNGTFNGNTGTITFSGPGKGVSGPGTQNFNNLSVSASLVTFSNESISLSGNLATISSGSFTQAAGGTLLMTGTGKTISGTGISIDNLTVSGTVTTAASFDLTGNLSVSGSMTASAGSITMNGTAKTISGAGNKIFAGLFVSGSITTAVNFTIANSLNVSGSFAASAGTATFTGASTLSGTANLFHTTINGTSLQLTANSTLGIASTLTITAGTLNVASSTPNTVNFNGTGAQSINAIIYNNLVLSNGNTKTAVGDITITSNISIETGTTFTASSYTHTINGDWINKGIFVAGASTVQFAGLATTHLTGATTFNILTSNTSSASTEIILNDNVSAAVVNMINGIVRTGSDTITITNTRTGNGFIYGNIQRNHAFTTGVAYAFKSPYNTITFSSVSSVTSITVSIADVTISGFPFGGAVNTEYTITVPGGTYNATLRLAYEDDKLNGNNESTMGLWNYNGSSWVNIGKAGNDITYNYVEQSGLTNISNRWTFSSQSNIVRWNGSVSKDWHTAANWTSIQGAPSMPPSGSDIVDLGAAPFIHEPTISNSASVNSIHFGSTQAVTLTLASGGSLTVAGNIKGDWSGNATHTINVNDQTLIVNGDLILSDGINGRSVNLNIGAGALNILGSLSQAGDASINFSSSGTLNIHQNFDYSSGTFIAGNGTFNYNGDQNQRVANVTYNNLTISKAAGLASIDSVVTIAGNLLVASGELDNFSITSIAGNVTIAPGASFQNHHSLQIGGNWNNTGTYIGTGFVTFNGSGTQTISSTTFNNLAFNKPVSSLAILTGDVVIKGNLVGTSGTLDIGTYFFNRDMVGGSATISDSATIIIGANNAPNKFASYALSPNSTIIFNGVATQHLLLPGMVYGNLIFRNPGNKILYTPTTVKGNLTIESGSSFDAGAQTITLNGSWINNGTFSPSGSTIVCTGIGKTISGITRFSRFSVYGSYTVLSNLTFDSLLTINSGGTVYAGSNILVTLNGDLINSGTLYNLGTTTFSGNVLQTLSLINAVQTIAITVNFNGSVSPLLNSTSAPQFGFLNINNTGGVYPSVGWTIAYGLTIGSGASFNGGIATHNIMGSVTNNGTITSSGTLNFLPATAATINLGSNFSSTGLVNFGGAGAITLGSNPLSFQDVEISNTNAAGVTPASGWTVINNFTVDSSAIFNAGNHTYFIGNDAVNTGTINSGTSTFTFNGAANQTIRRMTFYNLEAANSGAGISLLNATVNNNLAVSTGVLSIGNNTVARTIAVYGNITIANGSTLNVDSASNAIHQLTVSGNIVNNGTLNLRPDANSFCNVTFNKVGTQTISGAGGTTSFNNITVNMGVSDTNHVDVTAANFSAPNGFLTLSNGSFKLNSPAAVVTPFTTDITTGNFLIPATAGLWVNAGTINSSNMNWTIAGTAKVTGGTMNMGTAINNVVIPKATARIILNGGNLNLASRISNPGTPWSYSMQGGTMTVNTQGSTAPGVAPFNMDAAGSSFNMSGGTLVIKDPGGSAGQNLGYNNLATAGAGFTGGTLQIGNSLTTASSMFGLVSTNPVYNLTVNSNNATAILQAPVLAVSNNVTVTSGKLNIDTLTIKIGGSITNSGTFIAANGTIEMNGTSAQTIPAAAFQGNNLKALAINNSAGVSLAGAINLTDVLTVSNGSLASNGYLTLKSTATATARVAPITSLAATPVSGHVIAERYVPGRRRYRLITSPVTTSINAVLTAGQEALSIWGQWQNGGNNVTPNIGTIITGGSSADGFDTQTPNASLYTYNDSTRLFVRFATSTGKNTKYTPIKAGVAYYMFVYGDRTNTITTSTPKITTISSTGTLLTGDQVYTTSSAIPLSNVTGRYTLLGNPFASPINWATMDKTNLENTYWGWDPNLASTGGYITVTTIGNVTLQAPFSGSTGLNQFIQSGQGFFVKTAAPSPVLIIREQDKVPNFNGSAFRTSRTTTNDIPLLAINLQYPNGPAKVLADGVVVAFDSSYSKKAGTEDAAKMANSAESIAIQNDTSSLIIDARPVPAANDTVFLTMARLTKPQYTLQIFAHKMGNSGVSAFLQDKYLNTLQPLSLSDTNNIVINTNTTIPASVDVNRFRIVFQPSVITLPLNYTSVRAAQKGKDIQVEWEVADESNIQKYTVEKSFDGTRFSNAGEVAAKGNNSSESYQWLDVNAATGKNYYRVRALQNDGKYFISKIVMVNMNVVKSLITVYPNPVKNGQINIHSDNIEKGTYNVELYDGRGRQIISEVIHHSGGLLHQIIYPGNKLTPGVYHLKVTNITEHFSQTIFIE